MVGNQVTDGTRIAELLASELDGRTDGWFDRVTITNVSPDAEPSIDGTDAYDIVLDATTVGTAYLHPERVRLEFTDRLSEFIRAAHEAGVPVQKKSSSPPRVVILLGNGAAVKHVLDVMGVLIE